jgi:hypothetical protein
MLAEEGEELAVPAAAALQSTAAQIQERTLKKALHSRNRYIPPQWGPSSLEHMGLSDEDVGRDPETGGDRLPMSWNTRLEPKPQPPRGKRRR